MFREAVWQGDLRAWGLELLYWPTDPPDHASHLRSDDLLTLRDALPA